MADITLTIAGVALLSDTSATATVYEDVGNDGSGSASFTAADGSTINYDNSASTSLVDGQHDYTLSGFDAATGNAYYVDIELSNTDPAKSVVLSEDASVTV